MAGAHHSDDDPPIAARVAALEAILTEKGLVDRAAMDALIDMYETKVGPHNGARIGEDLVPGRHQGAAEDLLARQPQRRLAHELERVDRGVADPRYRAQRRAWRRNRAGEAAETVQQRPRQWPDVAPRDREEQRLQQVEIGECGALAAAELGAQPGAVPRQAFRVPVPVAVLHRGACRRHLARHAASVEGSDPRPEAGLRLNRADGVIRRARR